MKIAGMASISGYLAKELIAGDSQGPPAIITMTLAEACIWGRRMQSGHILEADWKLLRKLHPILLERFCRRILDEIRIAAADIPQEAHPTYLELFELVQRRNAEVADAFDDMRRSMAIFRICHMRTLKLMTDEEFAGFSETTRAQVQFITDHD